MKIDRVITAVLNAHEHSRRENPERNPEIRVYMDARFWHDCMSEISGPAGDFVFEFYSHQTILGHSVYSVPRNVRHERQHPPFEVVDLTKPEAHDRTIPKPSVKDGLNVAPYSPNEHSE